jgi:hypothetical protein
MLKGVLSVRERLQFNICFELRFKEFYERVFRHYFNWQTCRLEDAAAEWPSYRANIHNIHRILNQLSFYPRREFRRLNTGERFMFSL